MIFHTFMLSWLFHFAHVQLSNSIQFSTVMLHIMSNCPSSSWPFPNKAAIRKFQYSYDISLTKNRPTYSDYSKPATRNSVHLIDVGAHYNGPKKKTSFLQFNVNLMAMDWEIAEISLLLCICTLPLQIIYFLPHGSISVTTMTWENVRVSNVSHGGIFTGPLCLSRVHGNRHIPI